MAEDHDQALSLAFMRSHPTQAARVLESLPVAAAAALFDRAPARLGAGVLAAMLPRSAARCVSALAESDRALELLAYMGTQPTVAILRHLPEPRRGALVAGLPTAAALATALLLGYTEDTLGAWADPDVVTLPPDLPVAEALGRLRLTAGAQPLVFVTGAERQLAGTIGLLGLLRAPAGAKLATLMQRPGAVLRAHAPLSGAAAHPGWESASLLPVVEPGERLVGVLTRDALARALRQAAPPAAAASATTVPALLIRGYWQTLSGLFESALVLLPRVPPVAERPDDRG